MRVRRGLVDTSEGGVGSYISGAVDVRTMGLSDIIPHLLRRGDQQCVRCGGDGAFTNRGSEYAYCQGCRSDFTSAEIVVEVSRTGRGYVIRAKRRRLRAGSQTDALAKAKYLSTMKGWDALCKYHDTRSRWLLDGYLEAHPGIQADVRQQMELSGTYIPVEQTWL